MAREEILENVPVDRVSTVIQGYIDDGASSVSAIQVSPGNWSVSATFD